MRVAKSHINLLDEVNFRIREFWYDVVFLEGVKSEADEYMAVVSKEALLSLKASKIVFEELEGHGLDTEFPLVGFSGLTHQTVEQIIELRLPSYQELQELAV